MFELDAKLFSQPTSSSGRPIPAELEIFYIFSLRHNTIERNVKSPREIWLRAILLLAVSFGLLSCKDLPLHHSPFVAPF